MGAIYRNNVLYTSGGIDSSDLANYVTQTDLSNGYYGKSQTYTKTEVDALIQAINSFDLVIASSLLTITNPNTHTLYFIPSSNESNNIYTEYVYLYNESTQTYAFEKMGSQTLDLSYTNASLSGVTTMSGALDALVVLANKHFVVTGSKAIDSSTVTISDARITTDSLCQVFADDDNLMYTSIVPTTGSVTITFDTYTHVSAIPVKVVVNNP